MILPEDRQEIEDLLHIYPTTQAAGLDALKVIQRRSGWVSDEELREVAALLCMSPAELDGVATFYNQIFRRPVGRHIIRLCDGVSCWVMGETKLQQRLAEKLGTQLGESTPDGRFTCLPVPCLGMCEQAPVMMVDDDFHSRLTPEALEETVEQYS
jgi:NADH-quinone oxidoreductase subunit E